MFTLTIKKLLKHFTRKIFYYIAALLFLLYGILATNLGLQSIFWISKVFMPGTLSATQITGSFIAPIEIENLQYSWANGHFKSSRFNIDLKLPAFFNNTLDIPVIILQNAEIKLLKSDPLIVHKASCSFKRRFDGRMVEIKIPEFDAHWRAKPLHVSLGIRIIDKQIYFLNNLYVKWGNNQCHVRKSHTQAAIANDAAHHSMQYEIDIDESTYNGHIQGTLKPMPQQAMWLGDIESALIQWPIGSKWVAKQSSQFQFSADTFQLEKTKLVCQKCQLGNFRFRNLISHLTVDWKDNHFNSHLELNESTQNFLRGNINIDKTLQGFLKGEIQDPHFLYTLFPQISKIKGLIAVEGKLSGTIEKPLLHLTLKSPSTQFVIPKYKLKVTNLNFHIEGNMPGTLSLQGHGILGDGPFNLEGNLYAFNSENNQNLLTIYLKGDHLKIANQAHCLIVASPDLTIKYEKNKTLMLDGIVKIDEANIHLNEQTKRLASSRDIVIVHSKSLAQKKVLPSTFKIIPNIQFILENNTHVEGYGLIGTVGGKLQVEERADGLLIGTGRLTIKEGRYRLQGKNRYIHRGRLLFPQGTLLTDPILDIKVTETKTGEIESDTDAGIYVQGTLQSPTYQLYSASGMKNAEILSKLGLGLEGESSTKKFGMTQSASLIAGSNPFIDKLSAFLGLEELSVTTRETESSQQNLSKTDTVLVVGKWLTDRLYIQYFQSVLEPISTAKIKYRLNKEFTASVESGTEGQGADLIYSIERD